MAGAAGEFLSNVGDLDAGTLGAIYLAVFISGITFTGSIVAFSKLSGMMSSKALALPVRDQLNLGMISVLALGMAAFLDPSLEVRLASRFLIQRHSSWQVSLWLLSFHHSLKNIIS